MNVRQSFEPGAASKPDAVASGKDRTRTRDCPRVTVRLSPDDHAKLTELADGMALSVYLRAKALGDDLPRRRGRGLALHDRATVAQLLGLLGQSRIANNLNQLAYHANIGSLPVSDETVSDIIEAYDYVRDMRGLLLRALGKTP